MYKKIIILIISFIFLITLNIGNTFAQKEKNGTGIIINNSSYMGFDSRIISLYGENFGTGGEVILKSGILKKIEWGKKKIVGKLPINYVNTGVYIQSNGVKSNKYLIKIKIPHINYIYSKKGFYNGEIANISGDNLNYYKTTKIKIDNKLITGDYKRFTLNNLTLGKHSIKLISGGFESNIIEFNIFSKQIVLDSVIKKYKNKIPFIQLDFNKELTNTGTIILYNNSIPVNNSKYIKNSIILDNYTLNYPDNYFQLKMNNTFSNIVYLKNNVLLPSIENFTFGSSFGSNKILGKRIIDLNINNFSFFKDKVYYNDILMEVLSCKGNTCRVLIPYDSYLGYFTVGNGIVKNNDKFTYNIKYDNLPLINNFNISGDLKAGSDFNILGSNLDKVIITSTNLFFDNKIIYYSNKSIKSIVGKKYNKDKKSTITFTSNLSTKTITFSGSSFINNEFYGPSIIKDFITDKKNTLFYPGTKVNILGKGFHKGDMINIGKYKVILDFNKKTFILPLDIIPGEYNINIENKFGIKSDEKKIIILKNNLDSILVESTNNDAKIFFTDNKYDKDEIYSLNIINKIDDLNIKKIQFNIKKYNEKDHLGTFILKLDGKEVGKTLINKKGEIIFENNIELLKNIKTSKLSLYKDSIYINSGKYSIALDSNGLDIFYKNKSYKKFSKINFNINSYDIIVNNTEIIKCYDNITILTKVVNNCDKFKINTGSILKVEQKPTIEAKSKVDNTFSTKEVKTVNKPNIENKNITSISNVLSVSNFNKSTIFKNLILSKSTLKKDRKYKKYIKEIDFIIPVLATNNIKIVNLYNKLEKLSNITGSIGNVIRYLKAKVDYEIYRNDGIVKLKK